MILNKMAEFDGLQRRYWVFLMSYIRVVRLPRVKLYVHMPHILQQVALNLSKLLTTYITVFYTKYI
jgi:hypothetical protein